MAAAAVRVRSHHTNGDDGGTNVDTTTIRMKAADNDTQDVNNQVPRSSNSFIKELTFYVTTAPTNVINNLKVYMTGTAVANVSLNMKSSGTYVAPVTQGTTLLTGTTNAYTYTAAAPLSINGSFTTGTDTAPKNIGDFVLLQAVVGASATIGTAISLGNVIFRWDEQ